jgi:hypothetical protein
VSQGAYLKRNQKWILEVLRVHNELRAKHGAPPLDWDPTCAEEAQLAANACASRNALFHSHHQEYGQGQNIFVGSPGLFSAKDAIESWYNEMYKPGYRWDSKNSPSGCPGTGHFSQVVWKDCTKVGMACDSSGKGFIVANYFPAGNMMGNFHMEVFPPGTIMQQRAVLRTTPFMGEVNQGSAELNEILATLKASGQGQVIDQINKKLRDGWKVELNFKSSPGGSLSWKFSKGGASGSGACSF